MKSAILLSALAAVSAAKVHRAKLHKSPLSEQFKYTNIRDHAQALSEKYLGRHPQGLLRDASVHPQNVLQDTSIHEDNGATVPIENFLNAQCKRRSSHVVKTRAVTDVKLVRLRCHRDRRPATGIQGRP